MNEPEFFLQNIMKNRIDMIEQYFTSIEEYVNSTADEEKKSRSITTKRIFLWLKDLYELQNTTINSVIGFKEWVAALHRETLGNKQININEYEQAESLRDRFENTFGKLEKTIKRIQSQEESVNNGAPYG